MVPPTGYYSVASKSGENGKVDWTLFSSAKSYSTQNILCFPHFGLLCHKSLREFEEPVPLISNGSPDMGGSIVHAVLELRF